MVKNLPMVSFHQHTQRIATGLLDCSVAIFDLRSGAPPRPHMSSGRPGAHQATWQAGVHKRGRG